MTLYTPPTEPYAPVLYCDDHILVSDKPSGLLTVPGRGPEKADCLFSRLQSQYPDLEIVHRLDMETSGLVLFALSKTAQSRLGRSFQERQVSKTYHAVIAGCPDRPSGRIEKKLIADWPNRPRQKVDEQLGKTAITQWQVLEERQQNSFVKLIPETGRTHQLRVHMQAMGHPILGDPLYAPPEILKLAPRLQLHASYLEFAHPATKKTVEFSAKLPF